MRLALEFATSAGVGGAETVIGDEHGARASRDLRGFARRFAFCARGKFVVRLAVHAQDLLLGGVGPAGEVARFRGGDPIAGAQDAGGVDAFAAKIDRGAGGRLHRRPRRRPAGRARQDRRDCSRRWPRRRDRFRCGDGAGSAPEPRGTRGKFRRRRIRRGRNRRRRRWSGAGSAATISRRRVRSTLASV